MLTLAAIVGLALAAAVAWRPQWLPVLLVMTVFAQGGALGATTVSRLVAPFALVLIILHNTAPVQVYRSRIIAAVVVYAGWILVSAAWTHDQRWTLRACS